MLTGYSLFIFPASNGYFAKPTGCRISVGPYVLCQVQRVDSCSGYSFKALRGMVGLFQNISPVLVIVDFLSLSSAYQFIYSLYSAIWKETVAYKIVFT